MGKERFDFLPVISEAVSEKVLKEMEEFAKLTAEAKAGVLKEDLELLDKNNPELSGAIEGLTDGIIDVPSSVADELTHAEWMELRSSLIYNHLLVLRVLNEAERERRG